MGYLWQVEKGYCAIEISRQADHGCAHRGERNVAPANPPTMLLETASIYLAHAEKFGMGMNIVIIQNLTTSTCE